MVWRNEANSRDRQQIKWDQNTLRSALEENNVKEVGDLILLDMDFIHSELFRQNGVFDELTVVFHFRRGHHKVLFLFFVPSVLFMIISIKVED
uniref:Uncharacterized protein n=1 Tax=Heterorhabditis bacteriophora TaxID=37862 RepID=A0A1I7WU66_HETBA